MTMQPSVQERLLRELITEDDIAEARSELYTGKILNVYNYRTGRVEHAQVDTWYSHVIMMDNGCSYTIKEYVIHKRYPNKPIGSYWSTAGKMPNVKLKK